jgi:hypothetical protein
MLVRRKTACHGLNSGGLNVSAAMPARHSACVAWVIGWVVMLVKQAGVTLMSIAARAMVELAIGWKRLLAAEHLLGGAGDDQQLNQPCPVSQACRAPLGRPLPVLSAVSISSLFEHAVRERLGCSAVSMPGATIPFAPTTSNQCNQCGWCGLKAYVFLRVVTAEVASGIACWLRNPVFRWCSPLQLLKTSP